MMDWYSQKHVEHLVAEFVIVTDLNSSNSGNLSVSVKNKKYSFIELAKQCSMLYITHFRSSMENAGFHFRGLLSGLLASIRSLTTGKLRKQFLRRCSTIQSFWLHKTIQQISLRVRKYTHIWNNVMACSICWLQPKPLDLRVKILYEKYVTTIAVQLCSKYLPLC